MSINYPIKSALGADVNNFPKTQQAKIKEIIDAVNDLTDGTISTTDLILTGDLTVGDTTNATSKDTGSIITEGGIGVEKDVFTGGKVTATTGVVTDTISEKTATSGITIDGVLIKDSTISLGDGTVADLSVKIGADANNGLYGVSDTQLGIAVEGTLVAGFDTNGVFTSIISEQVAATGVTIDSVLLIDGGVYATSEVETGSGGVLSSAGGGSIASFYPSSAQDDIAAGVGGAIIITNYYTTINTDAGGDTFTLANGSVKGQIKKIQLIVDGGGDAVITPTSLSGGTTITMADAGDFSILQWNGTAWVAIELGNAVDGITAPVVA